jgi:hypothetical protein
MQKDFIRSHLSSSSSSRRYHKLVLDFDWKSIARSCCHFEIPIEDIFLYIPHWENTHHYQLNMIFIILTPIEKVFTSWCQLEWLEISSLTRRCGMGIYSHPIQTSRCGLKTNHYDLYRCGAAALTRGAAVVQHCCENLRHCRNSKK